MGKNISEKSESDFFPHAEDPQKAVYILVGTLQTTKIEESWKQAGGPSSKFIFHGSWAILVEGLCFS